MASYAATVAALKRNIKAREDALPVSSEHSRSQFFLHSRPTAKVCLLFHGWTAAPYEFKTIGQALYQAGYNVLVPLMPGHGRAGSWYADQPPPLTLKSETYQRFAIAWLRQAQIMGQQVIVGGVGSGGTLAAWLATHQPKAIHRTILFAPYLANSQAVLNLFVQQQDDYCTWIDASMSSVMSDKIQAETPFYPGFTLPTLQVIQELGQRVLERSQQQAAAPMLILASESERALDLTDTTDLFQQVVKRQPKTWYHRVSTMLDLPRQLMIGGLAPDDTIQLIQLVRAFVESDLTWAEIEAIQEQICDRILQPQPEPELNAEDDLPVAESQTQADEITEIIESLNLADRVSPDLLDVLPHLQVSNQSRSQFSKL
ncbi:MAG: alpha/beta hydrolase [Thainema sp.]